MPAPRLLIAPTDVELRRTAARGPLAPLARSLAADHAAVRARELFVPAEKARMTRIGGRCTVDGTLLSFDPFAPRRHECPACGRVYDDEAHYRWWIFWYQLWLAERAVHGASLALVADDAESGAFACEVLEAYVDRYLTYPNRDNVLGPTRPFFSTYLESIWLLQLCIALDLLEAAGDVSALGARVRDRIVEPSRALIAQYDERRSNRQVWNAAALAAAARVLGDDDAFERAILGDSGVVSHLRGGMLADGTWYEGENYHQFAHRGLWYGVTLAERAGVSFPGDLVARFEDGFVAPFLTAFPDLTLPARRDSQWAISLRQWRWAESCELGLARRDDARLAATLAALYDPEANVARCDTGRWRTAAEAERNEPATRLSRADLGWRSVLHARAELPTANRWAPTSVLLPAQGIAVFRRDEGRRFAALDYGTSGGGHGHPDRLNVLLADGDRRWLDDMGTGSYVERALHWYRSSLAHNAPLVDGASQQRVDGRLDAYDERGDWGWALASATIALGVDVRRALVVGPDYVIERLEWHADRAVALDLPLHVDTNVFGDVSWAPADAGGAGALEDGFDFLHDVEAIDVPAGVSLELTVDPARAIYATPPIDASAGPSLRAWCVGSRSTRWFRATAPSSPGRGERPFLFARSFAPDGWSARVWDTGGAISDVTFGGDRIEVRLATGETHEHAVRPDRWDVRASRDGASRTISLGGIRQPEAVEALTQPPPARPEYVISPGRPLLVHLGEAHYRRSEESWDEAGWPTAHAELSYDGRTFTIDVGVVTPQPTFVASGYENPLDNERPEINGDGIQLYVRPAGARDVLGWLVVPSEAGGGEPRIIPLSPSADRVRLDARWKRTAQGYAILARLAGAAIGAPATIGFDLIVNETTPERERRRGQLVLSGAAGEFVYLQGDRHDPERFIRLRLDP